MLTYCEVNYRDRRLRNLNQCVTIFVRLKNSIFKIQPQSVYHKKQFFSSRVFPVTWAGALNQHGAIKEHLRQPKILTKLAARSCTIRRFPDEDVNLEKTRCRCGGSTTKGDNSCRLGQSTKIASRRLFVSLFNKCPCVYTTDNKGTVGKCQQRWYRFLGSPLFWNIVCQ